MKAFLIFAASTLLFWSCSTNDNNYKIEANKALVIVSSPVYDGLIAAIAQSSQTTLPVFKEVYITQDRATGNGVPYVRVVWADSSGYINEKNVLQGARAAVFKSLGINDGVIYSDKGLTQSSGSVLSFYKMISVVDEDANGPLVVFDIANPGKRGYINRSFVSFNPADLEFCKLYARTSSLDAAGIKAEWDVLATDQRFFDLNAHLYFFPEAHSGEEAPLDLEQVIASTETTGDEGKHIDVKWTNDKGQEIANEDIPGEFVVAYIYENGNESLINHLGDNLSNGYPSCIPVGDDQVAKFKLLFKPRERMQFTFDCSIVLSWEGGGPYTSTLTGEAGNTYSYIVEHENISYVTCGVATFKLTTEKGIVGTGVIEGDCGD